MDEKEAGVSLKSTIMVSLTRAEGKGGRERGRSSQESREGIDTAEKRQRRTDGGMEGGREGERERRTYQRGKWRMSRRSRKMPGGRGWR